MICIYCLEEREPESLTDEHVIPKALGGWLSLGKAACRGCNSVRVNQLDQYLNTKFPPTALARTDLGLKSYSKTMPKTLIVGHDDVVGRFEVLLSAGGKAQIKPKVIRRGDDLFVVARSADEALGLLAKVANVRPEDLHPTASGIITSSQYQFKERIDWATASKAVAKIFYCYLLLELGEHVIGTRGASMLRDYFLRSILPTTPVDSRIGRSIPFQRGTTLSVPSHHHVAVFDSTEPKHSWICLFGLFWFACPYDLSEFLPHGRMIAVHPHQRHLTEALTKAQGVWRFRTSIEFGWRRPRTSTPEIPRTW